MKLTQKETGLLKDLRGQEKLCTEKYTRYASHAADPQLKNLFSQIAQTEQGHFDTLTQIESGSVPAPGGGSESQPSFTAAYGAENTQAKQADCYLCTDALSTEKHASSLYDTSIFEFSDEKLRGVLNHIQKEEQGHGKMLYDYMSANGMYA